MKERFFDIIIQNIRNPKIYIIVIVVVFMFLLLFPYLDANIFYPLRMEKRIEILARIVDVNIENVSNNGMLCSEYNSIVNEINEKSSGYINSIFKRENRTWMNVLKFLDGAAVFISFSIIYSFRKDFESTIQKIEIISFMLFLGLIFGFLAKITPNIITPIMNMVIIPIIEITLLGLIVNEFNQKGDTQK